MKVINIGARLQSLSLPILSNEQKEKLNAPFRPEKVQIAAFQIGRLKASASDGKPGIFYQKFGTLLGHLLLPPPFLFLIQVTS